MGGGGDAAENVRRVYVSARLLIVVFLQICSASVVKITGSGCSIFVGGFTRLQQYEIIEASRFSIVVSSGEALPFVSGAANVGVVKPIQEN